MSLQIGKTKIRIEAEGCVDCGTEWSHGWAEERRLEVRIEGRKPIYLTVHICADCISKRQANAAAAKAAEPQMSFL